MGGPPTRVSDLADTSEQDVRRGRRRRRGEARLRRPEHGLRPVAGSRAVLWNHDNHLTSGSRDHWLARRLPSARPGRPVGCDDYGAHRGETTGGHEVPPSRVRFSSLSVCRSITIVCRRPSARVVDALPAPAFRSQPVAGGAPSDRWAVRSASSWPASASTSAGRRARRQGSRAGDAARAMGSRPPPDAPRPGPDRLVRLVVQVEEVYAAAHSREARRQSRAR